MEKNLYHWAQNLKLRVSILWDVYLSVYIMTLICGVLAIFSPTFVILLPLCLALDILILKFASFVEYKRMLSSMRRDISTFAHIVEIDCDLTELCMREIRRFNLFDEGNKYGTKTISVFRSKNKYTRATSYPFFRSRSIVLLHDKFNGKENVDRFLLLHEMCHCLGYSLAIRKVVITRTQVAFLTALMMAAAIVLSSWEIIQFSVIFCITMAIIESPIYVNSKTETEADVMALSIFSNLYGEEVMRTMARIFTNRYYAGISKKSSIVKAAYLLNSTKVMSRFMFSEDRSRFIDKLKDRISFEKEEISSKSLRLAGWLWILKRRIKKARQFKYNENVVLLWNPLLYYIAFPLFMFGIYMVLDRATIGISVPWWCLALTAIPFVMIKLLEKFLYKQIARKSEFIHNIIHQKL